LNKKEKPITEHGRTTTTFRRMSKLFSEGKEEEDE
jgi:hypothetical protein